jgi:hypothetical protein
MWVADGSTLEALFRKLKVLQDVTDDLYRDAQVRLMMQERSKGRTQQQAAVKANLKSRKTVANALREQLGHLPSQGKQRRSYRTRANPFAIVNH